MTKSVLRHAIVSTDIVLFGLTTSEQLVTVVAPVANSEYRGKLAFPGGLIRPQESAREAVERILQEKTGISADRVHIEDLRTYSEVARDIRGRVVSVAYLGYVRDIESLDLDPSCSVVPVRRVPALAYDHTVMLADAINALQERIVTSTVIQKLLPKEFTLPQLYQAYTIILGEAPDKRNFLKKIKALDILRETNKMIRTGPHRPAKIHTFTSDRVQVLPLL